MKRLLFIVILLILLFISGFILYVNFALPRVGSAPDITVELTPERLARGEYLTTHVMGCVDCHSQRDFSLYSGPVTGVPFAGGGEEFTKKTGAPGNFYASNLTPYFLKDWTDGEIYRAITTGVAKDGRALFPAMPYHLYGQASTEDIYSVIAYLRSLPAHPNDVPESKADFPFSVIMKFIPQKNTHGEIPDHNNIVEYGKYMITVSGCIDCHTPMKKGKYIMEEAYSGNGEFILPGGVVRSANITPDRETGIGGWSEEMFVNRFKMYSDSLYTHQKVGNGFNTIMPWTLYAGMQEYDLKAIYAYLHTLEPIKKQVVKFTPAE